MAWPQRGRSAARPAMDAHLSHTAGHAIPAIAMRRHHALRPAAAGVARGGAAADLRRAARPARPAAPGGRRSADAGRTRPTRRGGAGDGRAAAAHQRLGPRCQRGRGARRAAMEGLALGILCGGGDERGARRGAGAGRQPAATSHARRDGRHLAGRAGRRRSAGAADRCRAQRTLQAAAGVAGTRHGAHPDRPRPGDGPRRRRGAAQRPSGFDGAAAHRRATCLARSRRAQAPGQDRRHTPSPGGDVRRGHLRLGERRVAPCRLHAAGRPLRGTAQAPGRTASRLDRLRAERWRRSELQLRPARPPSRAPNPAPQPASTDRCRRPWPCRACRRPCRPPAGRRS